MSDYTSKIDLHESGRRKMPPGPSRSTKVPQPITSNFLVPRQTVPTNTQDVSQASKRQPHPLHPSSHAVVPESGPSTENALIQSFGRMSMTAQPRTHQTVNVVLFGEPGVGKSAVVNLITQNLTARVPSGTYDCLLQTTRYDVIVDNANLCIFETVGLGEPRINANDYPLALEKAYDFVHKLAAVGGVHLLLFCIRADRLTATTQSNYRLFAEVVFPTKVPLVLVVTGLEGQTEMERWWSRNKALVERSGIWSDAHACITTVTDSTPHQNYNYEKSREGIRKFLKSHRLKVPISLPQPHDWFLHLGGRMQHFVDQYRKPTGDVVRTLAMRLQLEPKMVQKFIDTMDQGNAQSSSRAGKGRQQGVSSEKGKQREWDVDPSRSDTTLRPQNLDTEKWTGEPQRAGTVGVARPWNSSDARQWDNESPWWRATGEAGTSQPPSRHWNAFGEEDRGRKWDTRGWEMTAGRVNAEPRRTSAPYARSGMSVSMDEIRLNFPHDLTGHVTRSEHPFAAGSYGDVYRGKFSMRGKLIDVAIKVHKVYLQQDKNLDEKMKRFYKEVQVWVKLEHENVLQLYGTVRDPNISGYIPAMVCPWIENGALSEYLERYTNLSIRARLILVDDVAHGLQYLHGNHVIHGDLSGSNVLVRADGSACIADFGLSTLLTAGSESTFATTRRNKGTVRWMDPKLLDSGHSYAPGPTTRSDVYSFGSIMLQTLTSNVPYHRILHDEQVIYAIMTGKRPDRPPQETVNDARWKFIEKCWSRQRPSSDEIVVFTTMELRAEGLV